MPLEIISSRINKSAMNQKCFELYNLELYILKENIFQNDRHIQNNDILVNKNIYLLSSIVGVLDFCLKRRQNYF